MPNGLIVNAGAEYIRIGFWSPIASGEANDGANVGAGAGVYRDKTGAVINLRSIVGVSGVTVTENADEIEISTAGTAGDVSGPASSVDEAVAVFDGATGKQIKESGATIDALGNIATTGTVDGRVVSADGATLDSHVADTANPHSTDVGNLGAGTLAELNSKITDAALDDSGDPRDPNTHAITHQDLGTDEINVSGLSGVLADPQMPSAHATTHQNGGADELSVAGLSGALADPQTPSTHAATHQNGGPDELNVAGLSGTLADPQVPSAHSSFHSDGGSDEITVENLGTAGAAGTVPLSDGLGGLTMTPAPVLTSSVPQDVTKSAAVVGVGTDAARDDHKHDIATTIASGLDSGTASAEGTSASLSRADHTHEISEAGVVTTAQPDDSPSDGAAAGFARKDHRHGIVADAPGAIEIGDSSSEGVSTSFSRADHQHAVAAPAAPQDVDKSAAAAGSGTSPAREDHKHNVVTAAAVGLDSTTLNSEGVGTQIARADHTHEISETGTVSTINPDDSPSDGSAAGFSRKDHVHGIIASAAGILGAGDVSAEGSATSFARSDHVHGAFGAGTVAELVKDPTGFEDTSSTTIAFVPSPNRRFTISPTGASFDFYIRGKKFTKSTPESVDLADTTGLWFIYYDNTGTLQASLTPWSFTGLQAFIAVVYWNSGQPTQEIMGDERHGIAMDWPTHQYLHLTIGARFVSGFGISGFVLNSDTDADVTIGIGGGSIADEDLIHQIIQTATPTNPFEQDLADPGQIPVYHRSGAGGPWVKDAANDFYFKNAVGGNQRIAYNSESGGSWAQTEAANGNFVVAWIFCTNSPLEPVIAVQGQREDSSLADARANNGFSSLNLGSLPSPEWKVLYRIALQTNNGYGGTRKARVQAVDDFRAAELQSGAAASATSHSSLSDLTGNDDHTQYQLRSEKSAANGYASLDGTTKVPIAEIPTAAPSQGIGGGNSEGLSTSVARSDHNHALRTTDGPTDLAIGAIADGETLQRSGTSIIGFNLNYTKAEALTRTTTTGEDTVKVSLVTPAVTGTFLLFWSAILDAANRNAEANLYNSTDATEVDYTLIEAAASELRVPVSRMVEITLTGAAKTYQLRFGNPPADTNTIGCQGARMYLWRVG